MREKTKAGLSQLADLIVEKFDVDKIIGCNEFLEYAEHLVDENEIEIGMATLYKYEDRLKAMCKARVGDESFTDDKFDQFLETYHSKKLVMTINYYSDGTYEKVKPQQTQTIFARVPEYSMFAEGEDGLIVLKGTYKGKNLDEINIVAGFDTAKRGWAKYMLQQDKNLTDDDRDVFTKIMAGLL